MSLHIMDPINSYLGRELLEEITPVVMVLTTSLAEEARQKNGVNFVEMLLPFSIFNRIDVPVRTLSDQPYRLQMFKLRLVYSYDIQQPNYEAAEEKLKKVVGDASETMPDLSSDPPQLEKILTKSESDHRPSWIQAFNKELIRTLSFSEHESFGHPVACLLVASSKDDQPINKFVDLFNPGQLPSLLKDGTMDPKILKHYLLLHDNQDGPAEKAANILTEMRNTFGLYACKLLCINSAEGVGDGWRENPWMQSEIRASHSQDIGSHLNIDDLNAIKDFMQDLAAKHVIPHTEKKICILNQQVSATRKGFRNQIKNLWWRKGKEDSPEAPNSPLYTFNSIESQIRILGDYAFMLRDYDLALSNYRLLSTDYKLDKAWKCYAGVQDMKSVDCVYHFKHVRQFSVEDDRVLGQLARAGFIHLSRLDYVRLDRPLITCLIERWRPETCTFHLRVGEMTITLQDVAVLLGLRIDRGPVIARLDRDWPQLCEALLGRAPPSMSGGLLTLDWLRSAFQLPGVDADYAEIEQYTRGYLLHLIGAFLFPDASRTSVHCKWLVLLEDLDVCGTLSWGSALLAHLYSEMSAAALRERSLFCGCAALVQMWSWTRLAVGSPSLGSSPIDPLAPFGIRYNCVRSWDTGPDRSIRFYRDQLDMLEERAVMWEPYSAYILQGLPELCRATPDIWRARTHMICFSTVACHQPDRVLRQFGMAQHIPDAPMQAVQVSRRGKQRADWPHLHAQYVDSWDHRHDLIVVERQPVTAHDVYMRWYWFVTRRFITTEYPPPFTYIPQGPIERDMEMMGLSFFMLDQSRKEAEYCMETAFNTYLKLGPLGRRNVTRCGLWWADMLKSRGQYKDAAGIYFRISSVEPSLHAAVMLEQASYCYLFSETPMLRKYGFHLVLAGNRYYITSQRQHAIRMYRSALSVYKGHAWNYISDHVHFNIGRWYAFLGIFEVAVRHMLEVLACSHQSVATQDLFLKDFFQTVEKMGKSFEVNKLQLPLIDLSSYKVMYEDHQTYASSTNANMNESLWQSLEEDMVPSGCTARFNWLESQPKVSLSKKYPDSPVCVVGESIKLEIELKNPLHISISVSCISLICDLCDSSEVLESDKSSSTSFQDGEPGEPTSYRNLSTDSSSLTSLELDLVLRGGESKRVKLGVTPKKQGVLKILGVRWKLSVLVGGYQYFEFNPRKKQKRGNKGHGDSSRNDLNFIVIKGLPKLEGCIRNLPKKAFAGDIRVLMLELVNKSGRSLTNMKMKISDQRCLIPGSLEDLNKDFPSCLERHINSDRKDIQPNIAEKSDSLLFSFPSDTTIHGGASFFWPLWFHTGISGKISLYISIYYEMESSSRDMLYRILRMHYDVEVLPSLDVSFLITPCPLSLQDFIVRMNIVNRTVSESFSLQQLSCVSDHWEISSLPAYDSICPSQVLFTGQAVSSFFKLKESISSGYRRRN